MTNRIVAAAFVACLLQGQTATPRPQFEVASIKTNNTGAQRAMIRPSPGGRLSVENFSLKMLVTFAYNLRDFQVSGGPGWMNADRFDIVAKAETNVPPDQMRPLLQTLLEDRFQLAAHRETKEVPIYALVIGKGGPKLDESKDGDCTAIPSEGMRPPGRGEKMPNYCGSFMIGPRSINASRTSMQQMAMSLSGIMGRTVVDKTGFQGTFNIHIEWMPDESTAGLAGIVGAGVPGQPLPVADGSGASIFTVLQEKMGLRLESQKGPVEILVVDRAEKPSDN